MTDYKLVPLGGRYSHLFAKVDIEDFDLVNKYKWTGLGYPRTKEVAPICNSPIEDRRPVLMSRFIMGVVHAGSDVLVDHKNSDPLDNQRQNLRICTKAENMRNGGSRGGSSDYKGVCWDKSRSKWFCCITIDYKQIHLGRFSDEYEAALMYDKAARKYFGEFAHTNFRL